MTDQQHPITPPPELVRQWTDMWYAANNRDSFSVHIATAAARWGADQELEACCEWAESYAECGDWLRRHRRSKPPSLKDQAYAALDGYIYGNPDHGDKQNTYNTIRRALEQLND